MRDEDACEILCQMPEGTSLTDAAMAMFEAMLPGYCWTASVDGTPACAFGYQPFSVSVWVAWAWGTSRMIRTIPAVTPFMLAHGEKLIGIGVRRVEARTIEGHVTAQKWLARLGCRKRCDLPDYGRSGETFELWDWTLADWKGPGAVSYRKERMTHVLLDTEAASTPQNPEAAERPEQGQRL